MNQFVATLKAQREFLGAAGLDIEAAADFSHAPVSLRFLSPEHEKLVRKHRISNSQIADWFNGHVRMSVTSMYKLAAAAHGFKPGEKSSLQLHLLFSVDVDDDTLDEEY